MTLTVRADGLPELDEAYHGRPVSVDGVALAGNESMVAVLANELPLSRFGFEVSPAHRGY